MFRTRFKKEIVAEFLPPARARKQHDAIILCDGMPSIPRKQALVEFLAGKGYWVFYPRWRGAWESGGQFLERSPHEDILDVVDELPKPIKELAFGRTFHCSPRKIFVIGGSFGGAASLLCSLDERITKVVANCPVVDWAILRTEQKKETSNPSYPAYIRAAFGNAYRLSAKNWEKLRGGVFYNPAHYVTELTGSKILMFHAKDDPYIPWRGVDGFARQAGIKLNLLPRGGHLSTEYVVRKHWAQIKKFFDA
jgi:pimeloyl-ACP methyl ester carboxylesterase